MKVLDLRCGGGHAFEGWFASEDDYVAQRQRGLLDCPVCGDMEVLRLPSAPRLNLSGARTPPAPAQAPAPAPAGTDGAPAPAAVARFVEAVADLLKNAQDVGPRFAEEARRIHYGQSELKAIRGQATARERDALADEGIEVLTLPGDPARKTPLQ